MSELQRMHSLAFKGERSAARRLAAHESIDDETALRRVLGAVAGAAGLPALLDARAALLAADAARIQAREERKALALAQRAQRHAGAPTAWRAWFDGSAHPNPGRCGIGAVLLGPAGARTDISRAAGYGNSSEAEYLALIAALEAAVACQAHGLAIYGDSRVVIDDMNGPAAQAAPALAAYRATAQALLHQLRDASLRWVPRHKNPEADALSQRAARASLADASE
jgi:ribonuclease HI